MAEVLPQALGPHTFDFSSASDSLRDKPDARSPYQMAAHNLEDPISLNSSPSPTPNLSRDAPSPRGHSRRHKSLALPAFDFNPSASSSATTTATTTAAASSPSPPPAVTPIDTTQSSPGKSRHRRIHSEFIGGDGQRSPVARSASPAKVEVNPFTFEPKPMPSTLPDSTARKGHRHRRSGAISSQDLSAVARQTAAEVLRDQQALSGPEAHLSAVRPPGVPLPQQSPTLEHSQLRPSNASPISSKSTSPVHVSFAPDVDIIPRRSLPALRTAFPAPELRPSKSSDGIEQRHNNQFGLDFASRDTTSSAPASQAPLNPSTWTFATAEKSPVGMASEFEAPEFVNLDYAIEDPGESLLSHNFDDDPTSTVVAAETPTLSRPASSGSLIVVTPTCDDPSSGSVIDLDDAFDHSASPTTATSGEDLKALRGKSFSAARRSMHSSGLPSGSLSTGTIYHRRTESAPSLVPPFFDRPGLQRLASATASEKGFEMNNVFEEEEEESLKSEQESPSSERADKRLSQGLGIGGSNRPPSDSTLGQNKRLSQIFHGDSIAIVNDETPEDDCIPRSSESTVTGTRIDMSKKPSDASSHAFAFLNSPPVTPDVMVDSLASTPREPSSGSTFSTPRLDTEASSVSDARHSSLSRNILDIPPDVRPSCDGVPSLMSSRSTATSNAGHRSTLSMALPWTGSDGMFRPNSKNSTLSQQERQEWRRKRSSIASLSNLLTGSFRERSHLSIEQTARCQTSDGLAESEGGEQLSTGKKKHKRLGRALKFWKAKPRQASPG